jgi:hypothetical protein
VAQDEGPEFKPQYQNQKQTPKIKPKQNQIKTTTCFAPPILAVVKMSCNVL